MPDLTFREYQEVKLQLSQVGFRCLKLFLDERMITKELTAQTYSENLMTLLLREQNLGAAQDLRVLLEEFQTHVDSKLKETKQHEDKIV